MPLSDGDANSPAVPSSNGAASAAPVVQNESSTALSGRDLQAIFRLWEEKYSTPGFDPVPILTRISEIFEEETDTYMQKDPDPFDERHPSRTDPECELGRMLKLLFRKDHFMTRLVNDYLRDNFFTRQNIQKSSLSLNIAACRLILVIMPGLETSAVFQLEFDGLIHRLYNWAENTDEPLRSYATGLLAAAMEVQDIAVGFRDQNTRLIAVMLKRLHELQHSTEKYKPPPVAGANKQQTTNSSKMASSTAATPGSMYVDDDNEVSAVESYRPSPVKTSSSSLNVNTHSNTSTTITNTTTTSALQSNRPFAHLGGGSAPNSPELSSPILNGGLSKFKNTINLSTLFQTSLDHHNNHTTDTNQSVDSKYVRYTIPIHPATAETSQMLILRYLTSMGEYQEFLGHVFEHNAMQLIFRYIETHHEQRDTCLTFEALKYLASLLCHKKFSLEFITHGGLERLLRVPRPSIAATGVSIALYYLAYCEDAMERICLMSQKFVSEVVTYALWLLGCAHDSGRCHATMFFGLSFQFKIILDEFDRQDGLRKLYNVISMLPILSVDEYTLNDDEECAARQLVRHVCVAMKKYTESHLHYKYTLMTRLHNAQISGGGAVGGSSNSNDSFITTTNPTTSTSTQLPSRAPKSTPEIISEQVRTLQELMPVRARWEPIDKILELNIVPLLLRIIAYSYEWNYSGRAETVRAALDILIVCCVIPRVHLVFCERMILPDDQSAAGINSVLGAAEGEIVADAEVQKAALTVIVHCVCSPIVRPVTVGRFGTARKRMSTKHSEELCNKIWESVRSNNGIIVLLQLMEVKTPITDADCIRGMACRALAGLARSETVRQIISKLPLFTNGQLQSLMRDPILQEKRTEHVQFQKYALELMERVSGKKSANQLDTSLANIHKANIVAQTKIQFNEQQLYELIHKHFLERGLTESASTLQREANLSTKILPIKQPSHHHSPFTFRTPIQNISIRSRVRMKPIDFNSRINEISDLPDQQQLQQSTSLNCSLQSIEGSTQLSAPSTTTTTPSTSSCTNNRQFSGNDNFVKTNSQIAQQSPQPIKLIKKQSSGNSTATTNCLLSTPQSNVQSNSTTPQQRSLQKQISSVPDAVVLSQVLPGARCHQQSIINNDPLGMQSTKPNITLDTIITEYLTNQHALCKNPMSTCPQFDLFIPHKCPDPRPNKVSGLSSNFAGRYSRRQAGFSSRRLDRRLVHSQFFVARILRNHQDSECFFTCCDFTPCASSVAVGSYNGEVKVFNINEGGEEYSFNCHESYVSNIKCNRDGTLLLTSCSWRSPLSALWNIEQKQFNIKLTWDEEEYMEFNNAQDKILGTKAEVATIYDLPTGRKISTFVPTIFNQYTKNRATFCPTDELILSDGVLWDVRSGKALHKFDKLNQALSGVFHPNGLEVVSNTEVWDLRTFHLLRTVPALDQCQVSFSAQNVIYGISPEMENRMDYDTASTYDSSFKTLDSYDYSSIATVDVKREIYDLSVNKYGTQIAIVENQGGYDSSQESVVRIYSVGRQKNQEDEAEDEDNEMEVSDDNSNSDNETIVFNDDGDDGIGGDGGGGGGGGDAASRRRRRTRFRTRLNNYFEMFSDNEDDDWEAVSSSSDDLNFDVTGDDDDDDDAEDDDDDEDGGGSGGDEDDDGDDNGGGAAGDAHGDGDENIEEDEDSAADNDDVADTAAADGDTTAQEQSMWVTDSDEDDFEAIEL